MKSSIDLQKIFKQLGKGKLFVVLSRGEIRTLRSELQRAYPAIATETKKTAQEHVKRVLFRVLWVVVILFVASVVSVAVLIVLLLGGVSL